MLVTLLTCCLMTAPEAKLFLADDLGSLRACRPNVLVVRLSSPLAERLDTPAGSDEAAACFLHAGATVTGRCPALGMVQVRLQSGEDLPSACLRMGAMPEVRYVEPDWLGEGGDT